MTCQRVLVPPQKSLTRTNRTAQPGRHLRQRANGAVAESRLVAPQVQRAEPRGLRPLDVHLKTVAHVKNGGGRKSKRRRRVREDRGRRLGRTDFAGDGYGFKTIVQS